jgi:hypothetical protein
MRRGLSARCARRSQKPGRTREDRWKSIEPTSRTKNRNGLNRTGGTALQANRCFAWRNTVVLSETSKRFGWRAGDWWLEDLRNRLKTKTERERERECSNRNPPEAGSRSPERRPRCTKARHDSSCAHLPRPDAETRRQLSRCEKSDRRERDTVTHCVRRTTKERQCGGKLFTAASGSPREAGFARRVCGRKTLKPKRPGGEKNDGDRALRERRRTKDRQHETLGRWRRGCFGEQLREKQP